MPSLVFAQTPTDTPPPFVTGVPSPTATLPASGSGFVRFDFSSSPAGFDILSAIGGVHSTGLGFQSVAGEMGVTGGFAMNGIYKVEYYYTAGEDYSLTLNICDPPDALCGDIVYAAGQTAVECATVCSVVFDVAPIFGQKLAFIAASGTVPSESLFVLRSVEVSYDAASNPEYDLDGDCPVLSPAEYDELEPVYAARCSRCFTTPTPSRAENVVNAPLTPRPTLDETLQGTYTVGMFSTEGFVTFTPYVPSGTPEPTSGPTLTPSITPTPVTTQLVVDFSPSSHPYEFIDGQGLPVAVPASSFSVDESQGINAPSGKGSQFYYFSSGSSCNASGVAVALAADFVRGEVVSVQWFQKNTWINVMSVTVRLYDGASLVQTSTSNGANPVNGWSNILTRTMSPAVFADRVEIQANVASCGTSSRSGWIDNITVNFEDGSVATFTPVPTSTPLGTEVADVVEPWVQVPTVEASDCSVAEWRDSSPVASFGTDLDIVGYNCYTVVPEISITIFEPDLTVDGVNLCITWFSLPLISFLGIDLTLDWLMLAVIAYLVRLLVSF